MRRLFCYMAVLVWLTGCDQTGRLTYQAYRALDHGRYQQAVEGYRQVLAIDPDYPNANYNLGRAYLALKQTESALTAFDEAVRQDPLNPRVLLERALAHEQADQPELAERDHLKVTNLAPDWLPGWQSLAELQMRQGKPEVALQTSERGLHRLPRASLLLRLRAQAMYELDKFADSEVAFGKALEADHGDLLAMVGRARARIALNKLELAAEDLANAQQIEPENPAALLVR
ncbi:MAG: tetratricopeptide repeat protein, partial [Candidatus Eremiobacteraeota bacterium]|nr:tetratricopeptide repeat protein [Candidatus Eremiobacteraeota bacterium]